VPPDELNHAPKPGLHFGYPYCHGGDIPDPEFGKKRSCSEFTAPAQKLGPHVAALGMRFYTGSMFPSEYKNQIFIAEHGSWNRSTPIGYRVTLVQLQGNRAVSYKTFAEGWLQGSRAWGRPVDVLVMPDGALLVSGDDWRGEPHLNPKCLVNIALLELKITEAPNAAPVQHRWLVSSLHAVGMLRVSKKPSVRPRAGRTI